VSRPLAQIENRLRAWLARHAPLHQTRAIALVAALTRGVAPPRGRDGGGVPVGLVEADLLRRRLITDDDDAAGSHEDGDGRHGSPEPSFGGTADFDASALSPARSSWGRVGLLGSPPGSGVRPRLVPPGEEELGRRGYQSPVVAGDGAAAATFGDERGGGSRVAVGEAHAPSGGRRRYRPRPQSATADSAGGGGGDRTASLDAAAAASRPSYPLPGWTAGLDARDPIRDPYTARLLGNRSISTLPPPQSDAEAAGRARAEAIGRARWARASGEFYMRASQTRVDPHEAGITVAMRTWHPEDGPTPGPPGPATATLPGGRWVPPDPPAPVGSAAELRRARAAAAAREPPGEGRVHGQGNQRVCLAGVTVTPRQLAGAWAAMATHAGPDAAATLGLPLSSSEALTLAEAHGRRLLPGERPWALDASDLDDLLRGAGSEVFSGSGVVIELSRLVAAVMGPADAAVQALPMSRAPPVVPDAETLLTRVRAPRQLAPVAAPADAGVRARAAAAAARPSAWLRLEHCHGYAGNDGPGSNLHYLREVGGRGGRGDEPPSLVYPAAALVVVARLETAADDVAGETSTLGAEAEAEAAEAWRIAEEAARSAGAAGEMRVPRVLGAPPTPFEARERAAGPNPPPPHRRGAAAANPADPASRCAPPGGDPPPDETAEGGSPPFGDSAPPQTHFRGHPDDVRCVAVHPAGRLVASGSSGGGPTGDPVACIWAASTGTERCRLDHGPGSRAVLALAFSGGSGRLLATVSGDNDHTVTVWDWARGQREGRGLGGKGAPPRVWGVAFDVHWAGGEARFCTWGAAGAIKEWRRVPGAPPGAAWAAVRIWRWGQVPGGPRDALSLVFLPPGLDDAALRLVEDRRREAQRAQSTTDPGAARAPIPDWLSPGPPGARGPGAGSPVGAPPAWDGTGLAATGHPDGEVVFWREGQAVAVLQAHTVPRAGPRPRDRGGCLGHGGVRGLRCAPLNPSWARVGGGEEEDGEDTVSDGDGDGDSDGASVSGTDVAMAEDGEGACWDAGAASEGDATPPVSPTPLPSEQDGTIVASPSVPSTGGGDTAGAATEEEEEDNADGAAAADSWAAPPLAGAESPLGATSIVSTPRGSDVGFAALSLDVEAERESPADDADPGGASAVRSISFSALGGTAVVEAALRADTRVAPVVPPPPPPPLSAEERRRRAADAAEARLARAGEWGGSWRSGSGPSQALLAAPVVGTPPLPAPPADLNPMASDDDRDDGVGLGSRASQLDGFDDRAVEGVPAEPASPPPVAPPVSMPASPGPPPPGSAQADDAPPQLFASSPAVAAQSPEAPSPGLLEGTGGLLGGGGSLELSESKSEVGARGAASPGGLGEASPGGLGETSRGALGLADPESRSVISGMLSGLLSNPSRPDAGEDGGDSWGGSIDGADPDGDPNNPNVESASGGLRLRLAVADVDTEAASFDGAADDDEVEEDDGAILRLRGGGGAAGGGSRSPTRPPPPGRTAPALPAAASRFFTASPNRRTDPAPGTGFAAPGTEPPPPAPGIGGSRAGTGGGGGASRYEAEAPRYERGASRDEADAYAEYRRALASDPVAAASRRILSGTAGRGPASLDPSGRGRGRGLAAGALAAARARGGGVSGAADAVLPWGPLDGIGAGKVPPPERWGLFTAAADGVVRVWDLGGLETPQRPAAGLRPCLVPLPAAAAPTEGTADRSSTGVSRPPAVVSLDFCPLRRAVAVGTRGCDVWELPLPDGLWCDGPAGRGGSRRAARDAARRAATEGQPASPGERRLAQRGAFMPPPLPSRVTCGHSSDVTAVAWHPSAPRVFASASLSREVWLLHAGRRRPVGHEALVATAPVTALAFRPPHGREIAVGGQDGSVEVFGRDRRAICAALGVPGAPGGPPLGGGRLSRGIACLAWSPSGRFLAAGTRECAVHLWETVDTPGPEATPGPGRLVRLAHRVRLEGHSAAVLELDWSPCSRVLRSSCAAREALVWDADAGRPLAAPGGGYARDAPWATWTSRVGWPVVAAWGGSSSGQPRQRVEFAYPGRGRGEEDGGSSALGTYRHPSGSHGGAVGPYGGLSAAGTTDGSDLNAVDRDPSGTLLAAADDSGCVRLYGWPAAVAGAGRVAHGGHAAHVVGVRFSADGARLVSAGGRDRCCLQWCVERPDQGGEPLPEGGSNRQVRCEGGPADLSLAIRAAAESAAAGGDDGAGAVAGRVEIRSASADALADALMVRAGMADGRGLLPGAGSGPQAIAERLSRLRRGLSQELARTGAALAGARAGVGYTGRSAVEAVAVAPEGRVWGETVGPSGRVTMGWL